MSSEVCLFGLCSIYCDRQTVVGINMGVAVVTLIEDMVGYCLLRLR